jgi:diamine N-acetyltransferase
MATVELREVTGETVRDICRLKTTPEQEAFVAPNAVSIAEAYFEPKAWFRAIYTDGAPVGFVMLHDDRERQRYYLWRLLIDATTSAAARARQRSSWSCGSADPSRRDRADRELGRGRRAWGLLPGLGFVLTGEVDDGEVVARLPLVGRRPTGCADRRARLIARGRDRRT